MIHCIYRIIQCICSVSALSPDTLRYNTYCIRCIGVQIQWIQCVSAPGPDTVDTYRACRVMGRVAARIMNNYMNLGDG